jgi:hypothetical protein
MHSRVAGDCLDSHERMAVITERPTPKMLSRKAGMEPPFVVAQGWLRQRGRSRVGRKAAQREAPI